MLLLGGVAFRFMRKRGETMRAFAEQFYKSRAWIRCQKGFMESKFYTCERCGLPAKIAHHKKHLTPDNINDPAVALNWDNLQALCMKCHAEVHGNGPAVPQGCRFDAQGNLVPSDTPPGVRRGA